MAAIGKIRSWGPTLVGVIGLALFAFIAEELFRSCEATKNEQRQQVGQVLDEKISVQEFQDLVDEYQDFMKVTQQKENFSEDELNRIKDQVWSNFIQYKLIEEEANELGLTVTDEEMQNILKEGTNPILLQTPFVNQQTRLFDVNALTQFLAQYKQAQTSQNGQMFEQYQTLYKYWKYIEKTLRQQTLMIKYHTLLTGCLFSNPVSAKASFEDQNNESTVLLASLAYSNLNDNDFTVEDAELKAKYNEDKEMYKQDVESRDIKYVAFQVLPSTEDRATLMATMEEAAKNLNENADPATVVRKAQSQVAYNGLFVTRAAMPYDIAAKVDSMKVGETTAPFETETRDGKTLNVVKLIAKTQLPDSIEFRAIQVPGQTLEAARTLADSIYTALKAGANFDTLAVKYNQTATKTWISSKDYENQSIIDADTKNYINALATTAVNEIKNLEFTQGNLILQVTNRKAMVDKFDVAIVKHTIDFSKQTYSDAYNKFSQFVSENKTIEALEENAPKFGFIALERNDVMSNQHNVVGIRGTREAMKWIFDAEEGEVSPLYECGENDRLLVIALTKIHPVGYRSWDAQDQKENLKQLVLRDKKFDKYVQDFGGVKNIAEAQQKGARVDTVKQITFAAPVYVSATGASEPALSGAIAAAKQGEFSKKLVKGNKGAYLFEVLNQNKREGATFDEKQQEQMLKRQAAQAANYFMQDLYEKAKIVDNRYLFF